MRWRYSTVNVSDLTKIRALFGISMLALGVFSCEPQVPEGTGGVTAEASMCGRGLAVLMTDYESANVALLDFEGNTLSASFISSASAETKLNAPLSGDVVFPTTKMEELVLIDRYPASVLTFVDFESAEVRTQLEVRTGFNANPQDYLRLDENRALVSRYEINRSAGEEEFDGGDDLLLIDPTVPEISERLAFDEYRQAENLVRLGTLVRLQDTVFATLSGYSSTFKEAGSARLALLDADSLSVQELLEFEGLKVCRGLAVSPSEKKIALSCTGLITNSNGASPEFSGVVLLEQDEAGAWHESRRYLARDFAQGPFSESIDFANEELLLVSFSGALEGEDAGRPDRVVALDLGSGSTEELLASREKAFNLGDIQCVPGCDLCFVADVSRNVVHRFALVDGVLQPGSSHRVEVDLTLPPRRLGLF